MRNGKASSTPRGEDGFAQRLRELRKQHGFSQAVLGERVGVHYTHIGRYERGRSRPAADTLKRLADVLGVSGDYLLEGAVEEAARARFEDRELLRQFQEVEKLPDDDKVVIKRFLDAFLTKKRLQELAAR
jgi:transcriptional regulator with XRE-family HTH domain